MDERLSVLTWNVQGEIGIDEERMQSQVNVLREHVSEADLFLFQAVNYELDSNGQWGGQLGSLIEYFEAADDEYDWTHTADWAHELYESDVQPHQAIEASHNRCNLTVSRCPIKRTPLSLREFNRPNLLTYYTTHFPEKLLAATVTTDMGEVDVWNVAIVNHESWSEEKVKMLETVYNRIYVSVTEQDRDVILGGDFNAPKRETSDGAIVPHGQSDPAYRAVPQYGTPYYFGPSGPEAKEYTYSTRRQRSEANVFDPEIGEWRMRDAYWAATQSPKSSSEEDHTHKLPNGTKKRLDHVLVSDRFDVRCCRILNDEMTRESGPAASDHAPVLAEVIYSS